MLVNNAAVVHGKSLMDSDDDALLKSQHINTLGQFWVRPAGLQQQLAYAGAAQLIVLITSIFHFQPDSVCGRQPHSRQAGLLLSSNNLTFGNCFLQHLNPRGGASTSGVGDQKAVMASQKFHYQANGN